MPPPLGKLPDYCYNFSVASIRTCDQASSLFSSGKECLIQLLDYLSVATVVQNLDFSLIGQLPVWQCDFRSKKSRELMASDEASEGSDFLAALNASLEVHKTLKYEQI